jgi:formylglycine-generating enzyme required for sulfatase activity
VNRYLVTLSVVFTILLTSSATAGALTHKKGMVLVKAKDSTFEMGQVNANIWGAATSVNESPRHKVSFTHDFWLDTTEVTQGDYDSLMNAVYSGYASVGVGTFSGWSSQYGLGDDYPAYDLAWYDAALYCNARSKIDGYDTVYSYTGIKGTAGQGGILKGLAVDTSKNGYRLPTEAEWEYACKGGVSGDYYWGRNYGSTYPSTFADSSEISSYVAWAVNAGNVVLPVAQKVPNAYGLYDILGNVYEWCTDIAEFYDSTDQVDPCVLSGTGLGDNNYMAVRGGCRVSTPAYLRSTSRNAVGDPSNDGVTANTYIPLIMGLRAARSVATSAVREFINSKASSSVPYISNNRVVFNAAGNGIDVTCEIISGNGARIAIKHYGNINTGSHVFSIPSMSAKGLCFVRLKVGNESYVMRIVNGFGNAALSR